MRSLEQTVKLVPPQARISQRISDWLAIGACMAFPIAVSLFFLLNQSLRLDESQSLWQTSRGFMDILSTVATDVHVPLYHFLLHVWRLFVGDTVPFDRMLSLVLFVSSIPVFYVLGVRAYDRDTAFFATFLFSISPFMNWYANEIRMYTLFTLLVIINQYFFLRLFRERPQSDHAWAGYALSALFGIYSHYFFFLNLGAQIIFYAIYRKLFAQGSLARFAFCASLVIAAFAPWVLFVIHIGQFGFQQPLLGKPSFVDFFNAFGQFIFGFHDDAINTFILSLWPLLVLLGLFSLRRSAGTKPETVFFLIVVACSAGIAFVASILVSPIFVSRYLIFLLPSLYLILANLFSLYPPGMRAIVQTSAICLVLLSLGAEIWSSATPVKENYREAATYLNAHVTPQDSVIVSAPFTIYPIQYYYKGSVPLATIPQWNQYAYGPIPAFNAAELAQQVNSITAGSQNVYVVLSYDQGYEKALKDYFESHYQLLDSENFSNDLSVYAYRLRYNTPLSAIPFTAATKH